MKKILSMTILLNLLLALTHQNVYAIDETLGVTIEGEVSIEAVATISADVSVNLTDKTTSSTYLYLENYQSTPVRASITNIASLTEGAPSTFIDTDENWSIQNSGVTDTKTKIGFYVTNYTNTFTGQNILPGKTIDLGLVGHMGYGDTMYAPLTFSNGEALSILGDSRDYGSGVLYSAFEIQPKVGYAWQTTDQTFQYSITIVFELADESISGKYWKNENSEAGIQSVYYGIAKSDNGAYYLVGAVEYDNTKITDTSVSLPTDGNTAITIVSETGKTYTKKLVSPSYTATTTNENIVTNYRAVPIDLSDLEETGRYYIGVDGRISEYGNYGEVIRYYHTVS